MDLRKIELYIYHFFQFLLVLLIVCNTYVAPILYRGRNSIAIFTASVSRFIFNSAQSGSAFFAEKFIGQIAGI